MLLPHGYEGQGPEHSSARLERFLILCAEDNMQVCNVTTPSQYFHLLRRQIKYSMQKPLIIMTPKSLLRLPEARSPKENFLNGKFEEFLDDNSIQNYDKIERLILTSGKVYYDLLKFREKNNLTDAAIIRIEQYYPFEKNKLASIFKRYKKAKKILWVQEEPRNMGAWTFLSGRISELLTPSQTLICKSRNESASPANGSAKITTQEQIELVKSAFI